MLQKRQHTKLFFDSNDYLFFVRINDLFKLYIIVGEAALACFCRADVYRIACYVTAVALFLDNFIGLTNILNPPIYGSNFIVV